MSTLGLPLVLAAVGLLGISGVPGLLPLGERVGGLGRRVAGVLVMIGSVVGLGGVVLSLGQAAAPVLSVPWGVPVGRFSVGIDALSAWFLIPLFVVFAVIPVYGWGYWKPAEHGGGGGRLGLFFGLLGAAMVLLLIVRDGALFFVAWEVMALSAFFLITVEDEQASVRHAGFVYLVAAHVGALFLLAFFALWNRATGSLALEPPGAGIGPGLATVLFLLALVGFGLKAGIMPAHIWLPGAHAGAPSHMSAVLSGVMLKMGVYGLVRVCGILPGPPVWWGGLLLGLGAVSGVFGIVFAIAQTDIKRLLAYSSIENIGIITMGLGLALLGRAAGRTDLAALGLAGALLHTWNHALFKPLLFLGAGSVMRGTGVRSIDQLGGLAKVMPRTAWLFLVGAWAICALPPLNGFVGEWFVYLGLFRTVRAGTGVAGAAVGVPVLAGIGALAALCFVRLYGAVFLGEARSKAAEGAQESPRVMLWPMLVLGAGCLVIGVFPGLVVPMLDRAVACWDGAARSVPLASLAPVWWISAAGILLLAPLVLGTILLTKRMSMERGARPGTWDCGYARPTARMQYTGSSLGQMIVRVFAFALRPSEETVEPTGLFPGPSRFGVRVSDTVLDRAVLPAGRAVEGLLARLWLLQRGWVQAYVLYILVIVVALLWWAWGSEGIWGNG